MRMRVSFILKKTGAMFSFWLTHYLGDISLYIRIKQHCACGTTLVIAEQKIATCRGFLSNCGYCFVHSVNVNTQLLMSLFSRVKPSI